MLGTVGGFFTGGGEAAAATRGIKASAGLAAKGAESAFDVAAAGGKHAGFLKNYAGRSPAELDRGINSIERQIAEHEQAIADPTSKIPNFNELDPRQQTALVTRKRPGDIARQREQRQILQRLRQGG